MHSRLSWVAITTVFIIGLLLAGWLLLDARQSVWSQAVDNSGNLALALSNDVQHHLELADSVLKSTRHDLNIIESIELSPQIQQSLLFGPKVNASDIDIVLITDAKGTVTLKSSVAAPFDSIAATQESVQAQRSSVADNPVIVRPEGHAESSSGLIWISRRLTGPDGIFTGVVSAGLQVEHLLASMSMLRTGQSGDLMLVFEDGTLVGHNPAIQPTPTAVVADPAFLELLEHQSGTFEYTGKADDVRRLYAYHRVDASSLIVIVAKNLSNVYAEWWRRTIILALAGVPLAAAALLLGWALARELERRAIAEQSASDRGAEFRTTFDHSADGLFLLRIPPEGGFRLERANAALTRLWSLPVSIMEGRDPRSFLPRSMVTQMADHWVSCVQSGRSARFALTLVQMGKTTELETVLTPVRDEAGRVSMLLGSARDITESRAMARQLAQAQKLEAVGQISAGVTHDFNNLLQTLTIGMREMMAQLPDTSMRQRLRSTLHAVERGVELTRRLLAFSHEKEERSVLLDPGQVIDEAAELLAWTLGCRIQLQTVPGEALWPIQVDRAQLEMCLLNLCANARDAMPNGGVLLVRARNASGREAGQAGLPAVDSAVISVQDTGIGMDLATRTRVFEAFFTTKAADRGSGLGLWMVRSFARDAGGDVRIESEIGKGTEVSLWLPCMGHTSVRVVQPADSRSLSITGAVTTAQEHKSVRRRILLVDDDELVRQALSRLLHEAGHEIVAIGDGEHALRLLESIEHFDLLIADQSVPGLTGTELVSASAHNRPDLPVMVITGFARLESVPAGVRVLHKPIDADVLLAEVATLLGSPAEPTHT